MGDDKNLHKVGIGSGLIVIGFALGALFQYAIQIILARYLGTSSYGVFMQALTVAQAFTVISMLGIHRGIPRFISLYEGKDKKNGTAKIISSAFLPFLLSTLLATAVLFLFSKKIALVFFSEPGLIVPLQIFSATIIPLGGIYLIIAFLRGFQNAKLKVAIDDFVLSGLVLIISSSIILMGGSLQEIALGYLSAEIITLGIAFLIFRRKYNFNNFFSVNRDTLQKLVSFSWPLFVVSILLIINKWAGIWILGYFSDSSQVGLYSASFSIAGMVFITLNAVNYMFLPKVSELYGEGNKTEINYLFSEVTRWILTVSIPIIAGLVIFPEEILELFFGPSYAQNPEVLSILSIGFFVAVGTGPAGSLLVSAGKTRAKMVGIGILSTTLILISIMLVPIYGVLGAAIATTIGYTLGHTGLLIMAKNEFGETPYGRDYFGLIITSLVSTAIIYSIKNIIEASILVSIALGVLFILIYVLLGLKIGAFKKRDINLLKTIIDQAVYSVKNRFDFKS